MLKDATRPVYKAGAGLTQIHPGYEGLYERQDDWSSVAYFYLDQAENGLPPMEPVARRVEGL